MGKRYGWEIDCILGLTRKQVRLLMISAEDHERIPDDESDSEYSTTLDERSVEDREIDLNKQVEYLRSKNGSKTNGIVERSLSKMKDRDFSRKDPKKNFIKKRSSGGSSSGGNSSGGSSDNIMDLVKMARQGKGGMSIKDGKKLPKRK